MKNFTTTFANQGFVNKLLEAPKALLNATSLILASNDSINAIMHILHTKNKKLFYFAGMQLCIVFTRYIIASYNLYVIFSIV